MEKIFLSVLLTMLQHINNIRKLHKICLEINHAKSVSLYDENKYVRFQTFSILLKAPFIIYMLILKVF